MKYCKNCKFLSIKKSERIVRCKKYPLFMWANVKDSKFFTPENCKQ